MKTETFADIRSNFVENQNSVIQLMNFDRVLLDFCIGQIEMLDSRLKSNMDISVTNAIYFPGVTLNALNDIRKNDSMRLEYQHIFNQCLVLSISYFSSTIHTLFKKAISYACTNCPELLTASNEGIKITFDELKLYHFNLTDTLGDLILKKKDISFQDMQSTHKAFNDFFNINLPRDKDVNNIILGQAARHSIVHASAIADEKFMKQIKDCNPRDIKIDIIAESAIEFYPDEINCVKDCMILYIDRIITLIEDKISNINNIAIREAMNSY